MSFIEKIEALTTKDYKTALMVLGETLTTSQLTMLGIHYASPNHDITATELAHHMGFAKFNAANGHYGGLAKKLCNFFHINPPIKLYILVEFIKYEDEWHWILRPNLVKALHELKWFDEIDDYVQYHNSEENDVTCLELTYEHGFKISTSRPVAKLIGNRIWLIGGLGENPRKYYLCNSFIVDKVGLIRGPSRFKYFVIGKKGVAFEPPILLNNLKWFHEFLKNQQNFSFGLRRIDKKYIVELEKLCNTEDIPPEVEKSIRKTGGGFGNGDTNRKVEKAAIHLVTEYYRKNGWSVQSVEQNKWGFDLICELELQEEHVEVKGVQGEIEAFIITSGEIKQSQLDNQFILYTVTSALTKPKLCRYTAEQFQESFSFEPISYRATIK